VSESTRHGGPTAVLPAADALPPPSVARRGLPQRALLAPAGAALIALLAVAGLVGVLGGDDDTDSANETPAGSVPDGGPVGAAPSPADSTAPSVHRTAALSAAVDGLDDAVRQTLIDGGLAEKAAEDLEHQVADLRKWIEEGKIEDFDKKLDDLAKKIDEFESKGELDAAGAARIQEAIDAVRTAA